MFGNSRPTRSDTSDMRCRTLRAIGCGIGLGLVGSEVPLPGGSSIVADREYVIESIVDPDAVRRVGVTMPMPRVSLTDDEVRLIADYIVELGV